MVFRVHRWETLYMRTQIIVKVWWFVCIAETWDLQFLSNAAAARLPAQQPKTQSAYVAHGIMKDSDKLTLALALLSIDIA